MKERNPARLSAAVKTALSEIRATRATRSPSSMALLAISAALSMPQARAAEYSVSTEAELRQAVLDANADGDTTATITLTGNIALASTTAFPALAKPITIDTNGFTLSAQ